MIAHGLIGSLSTLIVVTLAVSAHAITPAIPPGDIAVKLELVCDGLTSPVYGTHAGDRSDRLFIVDQAGQIRIVDLEEGGCLDEPFLDVTDRMVEVNPFFDERGLLGLAFHPRFRHNGRFFVRYSVPREGSTDEPCFGTARGCHEAVLSEFRVAHRGDNVADASSERVLFRIDEPQFNHNAGTVAFGRDGYLYFSLGDGGGAHDGLADTPPSHGPIGNGQNIETALGAILRIDVNRRGPGLEYGIPRSNPFAGPHPGVDEIYAYGLRNPYRFSFDNGRGGSGRLYLADVGQNLFEEINVVRKGGNYGWVTVEGFHCFDPFDPLVPPASCSGTGPSGEPLLNPVAEYNHGDGVAVIGGFVYRGKRSSALYGKYIFGDFSRGFFAPDGRLFWLDADGAQSDIFELQLEDFNATNTLSRFLFGFAEDERGELYVLTSLNLGPTGNAGEVWRLKGPRDRRHGHGHGGHGHDDDDDYGSDDT